MPESGIVRRGTLDLETKSLAQLLGQEERERVTMRALLSFMPAAAAAATRLSVCFTADIGLNIVTSADVQGFDADMRAEMYHRGGKRKRQTRKCRRRRGLHGENTN